MVLITKELKKSWEIIKANPFYVLFPVLTDILFVMWYGFVRANIGGKIVEYVQAFSAVVMQNAGGVMRNYFLHGFSGALQTDPQIRFYMNKILLLYVLLALSIYLVYCFFQGISWKLSFNLTGKKIGFYDFMKKFFLLNIVWGLIFVVYAFTSFIADFGRMVSERQGVEIAGSIGPISIIILVVLVYFSTISYSLIGEDNIRKTLKKTFYLGLRKIMTTAQAYTAIIIVIIIINYLLKFAFQVSYGAMMLFGLLVFMPSITWARVLINLTTKR